ncbi:MAG: PA0069 family radical SAM protein [Deltaproteobacteria bacterium]|nr:PA0069 family radical SAM protein [Deltaproteobacteria bacterium]
MPVMRRVANPPNPFHEARVELEVLAPEARLEVYEQETKSALSKNDSPDIGFTWSVNPYRGCFHACAYCYARPSHQYLGFGAGTDFDRKIVVKTNIAERLRAAFEKKSWTGETVVFSGNTDCYQPLEASYELTRACLEVCVEYRNPVSMITKSKLVRRDVDLLARLTEEAACCVTISVPFADDAMARAIEPNASPPSKRLETVRILAEAGVDVGVSLGPIIPGLNDDQILPVLERAAEAGAKHAFPILLRLPKEVRPVFEQRLEEAYPLRADKVRSAIRQMRDGKLNDARFGQRMRGSGPRWAIIEELFTKQARRLGLRRRQVGRELNVSTFRRPPKQRAQLDLF